MELDTVSQIREKRDEIREQIKDLDFRDYADKKFGKENEYTFKGLIGGIEALLTDISTLTRYPSKFVKISSYTERNNILKYLRSIDTYFATPIHYINEFDALKILLRSFNVRYFTERQIEFEKEVEDVRKIKHQLQEILINSKQLKDEIDESNKSIDEKLKTSKNKLEEIENELITIITRKTELTEQSETLESINTNLESIKESASENLIEIEQSLTESKSNEKLITSFADKIIDRETKFDELDHNTALNNEKLKEYEIERQSILEKANNLIESSKKALNYTTAQGISASFQEQYNKSNSLWILGGWIIGAIICLIGAIILGLWILDNNNDTIGIIIGRLSLLPLLIIGTIFCANQFTKQKNIIEDYAYKMVLSKAIVGFSEQLKKNTTGDNDEYVHYIKTALVEIHKDPLRKRINTKSTKAKDQNLNELIEIAEKIVKLTRVN